MCVDHFLSCPLARFTAGKHISLMASTVTGFSKMPHRVSFKIISRRPHLFFSSFSSSIFSQLQILTSNPQKVSPAELLEHTWFPVPFQITCPRHPTAIAGECIQSRLRLADTSVSSTALSVSAQDVRHAGKKSQRSRCLSLRTPFPKQQSHANGFSAASSLIIHTTSIKPRCQARSKAYSRQM